MPDHQSIETPHPTGSRSGDAAAGGTPLRSGRSFSSFASDGRPSVVIVGGGFSGALVATRILDLAGEDIDIIIIERSEGNLCGGVAYGADGAGWELMLNIQAGRISLFREEPNDFLSWANNPHTARTDWRAPWNAQSFEPWSPVPRRMFAQYIENRLAMVAAQRPRSRVRVVQGDVFHVDPRQEGVTVSYRSDNGEQSLFGDVAVLATGHQGPIIPVPFGPVIDRCDLVIADPYSAEGRQRLLETPEAASVLIVGTGLTSNDLIHTLLETGHQGRITTVSRHGHEHPAYPLGHEHDIPVATRRPRFVSSGAASVEDVVDAFVHDFAKLRRAFVPLPNGVRDERTWKALEPYIAEFCQTAEPQLVQELIRRFKSAVVASRIGSVPEIVLPILALRESGRLSKLVGEASEVTVQNGELVLTITHPYGDSTRLTVDRAVLAVGRNPDFSLPPDPLWASLRRQGFAKPEPITRLGVAVDEAGQLLGDQRADRLFLVGPMRQGDELVRRGRTGAFAFSIGTLRNQAHHTALAVSHTLRRTRMLQGA